VWNEKSKLVIEEYIFARYYMYQNVYLHKTTRGFEKMLEALWKRAQHLQKDGVDVGWVPALKVFLETEEKKRTVEQYLRIEEFTVLQQIQNWTGHGDKPLSRLARSFMNRERFALVHAPAHTAALLKPDYSAWEEKVHALLRGKGFDPPEVYVLKDEVKGKYNQPYFPEKESDEQSARNAIRVLSADGKPQEISSLLPRLKPVTEEPPGEVRYYVPAEVREDVAELATT
jgi:HD superfamily phosphohydrolase